MEWHRTTQILIRLGVVSTRATTREPAGNASQLLQDCQLLISDAGLDSPFQDILHDQLVLSRLVHDLKFQVYSLDGDKKSEMYSLRV